MTPFPFLAIPLGAGKSSLLPLLLSAINFFFPTVEGGDKMKARSLGFLAFSLGRGKGTLTLALHLGTTGMQDLWSW